MLSGGPVRGRRGGNGGPSAVRSRLLHRLPLPVTVARSVQCAGTVPVQKRCDAVRRTSCRSFAPDTFINSLFP
eukprot:7389692-Pyramimonas_sp.AAC.2